MLSKDQNGCRKIQKKLDDCKDGSFQEKLLLAIIDSMSELMMDSFANYLC
jgi:hypothetical protein